MIAQLTHLRPKPDCFEAVIKLLDAWARETATDPDGPRSSFLSQASDHLFVVSIYESEETYKRAIARHDHRRAALMALLVENHGPTYFGPVLNEFGRGGAAVTSGGVSGLYIPPLK